MSKKDLQSVTTNLATLAGAMPSQHVRQESTPPPEPNTREVHKPEKLAVRTRPDSEGAESSVQFSFSLRKSLRKKLSRLAADHDMTIRAFILDALRARGLKVTDDDLRDMRKR